VLGDPRLGDPEQVKVRRERVCPRFDDREDKVAVRHVVARRQNVRGPGLNVGGIPRFHPGDAVAETFRVLFVVVGEQVVEPVVVLLNSDDVPVSLDERPVGLGLVAVLDVRRTIYLGMTAQVAIGRGRLLPAQCSTILSPRKRNRSMARSGPGAFLSPR